MKEEMTVDEVRREQPISEEKFLGMVLDLAKCLGWRSAHFRPGRTEHGWRTAVQGDGKGFPDLILVRGFQLIAAELKREDGVLSPEQDVWLSVLTIAGVKTFVWRPSDWDEIEKVLRGK